LAGAPFGGGVQSGDNFTLTIEYPLPHSFLSSSSGDTVTLKIPYKVLMPAVVSNYTVRLQLPNGVLSSGPTRVFVANASDLTQGTANLAYAVSPGWAADQAVPVASLVFGIAFVFLAVRRQTPSRADTKFEEEEEEAEEREDEEAEDEATKDRLGALTDLIQALGDKIALINESVDELSSKPQGTVARAEFARRRSDLDALRSRALRSLTEARQRSTSDTLTGLLNQVQEAEREEDRAAKDMLNLFDQYQSRRMRTDTYRRLLPSYRRRLDAAINKLSDLLSRTQGEAR
jgi:molecular chaperone GrpE (heat shock protein)